MNPIHNHIESDSTGDCNDCDCECNHIFIVCEPEPSTTST